jgi:cyclin-dependent kinase 8/11
MERHKIRSDDAQFHLLQRMLTMDPTRRITAKDAMDHEFFKEDPQPTSDIFSGCVIPYPKREFLNEDSDDKNSSSKTQTHVQQHGMPNAHVQPNNNTNQQSQPNSSTLEPPNKKLRINAGKVF